MLKEEKVSARGFRKTIKNNHYMILKIECKRNEMVYTLIFIELLDTKYSSNTK